MNALDNDQMEILIQKIKNSSAIRTELAKKVIIWLVLKSENGTKKVVVSIYPKFKSEVKEMSELAKDVWDGVHDNGDDFHQFFETINSPMRLSQSGGTFFVTKEINFFVHEGSILDKNGVRVGMLPEIYTATIWFAPRTHDGFDYTATLLDLNMEEINAIVL